MLSPRRVTQLKVGVATGLLGALFYSAQQPPAPPELVAIAALREPLEPGGFATPRTIRSELIPLEYADAYVRFEDWQALAWRPARIPVEAGARLKASALNEGALLRMIPPRHRAVAVRSETPVGELEVGDRVDLLSGGAIVGQGLAVLCVDPFTVAAPNAIAAAVAAAESLAVIERAGERSDDLLERRDAPDATTYARDTRRRLNF